MPRPEANEGPVDISELETYYGHISTQADVSVLLAACDRGDLHPIGRSLTARKNQALRPGSVFVWQNGSVRTSKGEPTKYWRDGSRKGHGWESHGYADGFDLFQREGGGLSSKVLHFNRGFSGSNDRVHLVCYYADSQLAPAPLLQPSKDPRFRHIEVSGNLQVTWLLEEAPCKGQLPVGRVRQHCPAPVPMREYMYTSLTSNSTWRQRRDGFLRPTRAQSASYSPRRRLWRQRGAQDPFLRPTRIQTAPNSPRRRLWPWPKTAEAPDHSCSVEARRRLCAK